MSKIKDKIAWNQAGMVKCRLKSHFMSKTLFCWHNAHPPFCYLGLIGLVCDENALEMKNPSTDTWFDTSQYNLLVSV